MSRRHTLTTGALFLIFTAGCSLIETDVITPPITGEGGGTTVSTGITATSTGTVVTTVGAGGAEPISLCDELQQQPAQSWAADLGECIKGAEPNGCAPTRSHRDGCGINYIVVAGERTIPAHPDNLLCGEISLANDEDAVLALDAQGNCLGSIELKRHATTQKAPLASAASPEHGLLLAGTFRSSLIISRSPTDNVAITGEQTTDGGLTHGFLARVDHTGSLTAQAVIRTTDKETGLDVAAIGANANYIFVLMTAKGEFDLINGEVSVRSAGTAQIETVILAEYSKQGLALGLRTLATHPTSAFHSLSLHVNDHVLIAYFQGGSVNSIGPLGLETPGANTVKVADSNLAGGRLWWKSIMDQTAFVRRITSDPGTVATGVGNLSAGEFSAGYTSHITKEELLFRNRGGMEDTNASASNKIVFGLPNATPEFAIAQLLPLANESRLVVGFYAASSIGAIKLPNGPVEELEIHPINMGQQPWRSFMIRMGSDMLATKHQVFTATEDLAMKGATIQQQEGDKLQVLVHGEFNGILEIGPAKLSAPTVHDFAASISW